jgi:hypothetical protein
MANPSTVPGARAQAERDPGSDHRDRESYVEGDEQGRRHRDAAFGRARFEHDPGGPFEDGTRTRADQRTPEQEQREARCGKAHGDNQQHETREYGGRSEGEHARR